MDSESPPPSLGSSWGFADMHGLAGEGEQLKEDDTISADKIISADTAHGELAPTVHDFFQRAQANVRALQNAFAAPTEEDFDLAGLWVPDIKTPLPTTPLLHRVLELVPRFDTQTTFKSVMATTSGLSARMKEALELLFPHYQTKEIVKLLEDDLNIVVSERGLKARFTSWNWRRVQKVDTELLGNLITRICNEHDQRVGYRTVWFLLASRYDIRVPRDDVEVVMRTLFPAGAAARLKGKLTRRQYNAHGARYASHMDGGDKAKYYGFPYWLELDGWSRYIIFLDVVDSNNDPVVTSTIWLSNVRRLASVPVLTMFDAGGENILIHTCQTFLRRNHTDVHAGINSAMVVTSTHNQRAEAMNRIIRERVLDHFLEEFADLEADGCLLTSNPVHMVWYAVSHTHMYR
jgi:hypothetical protein